MGWASTARRAAAEEYGRQNWRRFAARRQAAASLLVACVVVTVAVGWVARHWEPSWTPWLVGAVVGVPVLFLVAVAARVSRW